MEHLDFENENRPGADKICSRYWYSVNTWYSCGVLRHKRLCFVNRERTAFRNLFYAGFTVCYWLVGSFYAYFLFSFFTFSLNDIINYLAHTFFILSFLWVKLAFTRLNIQPYRAAEGILSSFPYEICYLPGCSSFASAC